jgi:adenosylcobinamide-GDP ribazoletransferase
MTARISRLWGEFWLAMTFLTTLPAPTFVVPSGGLGLAGRWFPLVGLVIALLLCVVQSIAARFFPPTLVGALVVLAWVVLTGGLHLDGLADCCDGLLATTSRERRLEILRDPRLGTFGALGLILTLLLKTLAAGMAIPFALLLAPVWGRWLLLFATRQPQARAEGMGASFAAGVTPEVIVVAAALPVLLLFLGDGRGLAGAALALAAMVALVRLAKVRLGGVTGDVYGLVVEVSEVVMLLAFAATPNWG